MTSTPQNSRSRRSQLLNQAPLPRLLRQPSKRFRFLGSRVFFPVLSSALIGIGSMTFLFTEIIKSQAEQEIQNRLNGKAHSIDSTLAQTNTLANTFRTSLLTLHQQGAKTSETYRRLTLGLFKDRPAAVTGIGFGQSPDGLLPDQQWLFHYFFTNSSDPNAAGQPLPAPNENIRYIDGTQKGNFYPDTERYRNFFLSQIDLWTLPYQSANGLQTTYYTPIFNDRGRWLGTVFVDIDNKLLQESLAEPVLNQGGFFALLTPDGQVVSAPAGTVSQRDGSNGAIQGLDQVWQQMLQGQSGLIEGRNGYWAYARVPQNRWITIAFVPYGAVFSQLVWFGIGGTVLMTGLLLLILALALRSLQQRLRSVLDECDQLELSPDAMMEDEITLISLSFSSLLERLRISEAKIQRDVAHIHELETQLVHATEAEGMQESLQAEIEHLSKVMSAIEQGDLAVTAQSKSQLTRAVSESLNRLTRRLTDMMDGVVSQTEEVTQDTQQVKRLVALIGDAAQQQIHEADQVQTLIDKVNTIAQDASLQAIAMAETVEQTRTAIREGQPEIGGMADKVNVLRQGTNQLVKRTNTLTNYVELTTQFAKDQKRIAAMTRVLAANASMLASRASGQQDPEQFAVITREFETIADQVNQLASQTNQSLGVLQQRSDQIQMVVSGLDYDIQALGQQINQFDAGIDRSQQLFEQMQRISDCVAQLGQQFSDSHQAFASAAQTTLESIRQISSIASTTLDRADLTQEEAQQIEQRVQSLLHQIELFQFQPAPQPPEVADLVGAAAKRRVSDV